MSMETDEAAATSGSGGSGGSEAGTPVDLGAMTEEEQIAYAMRMSMQEDESAAGPSKKEEGEAMEVDESKKEDYSEAMNDPAFLQNVLENLPGVDPQSEAVKSAMGAVTGEAKGKKDGKDKDKKDDDGGKK